MLDIRKLKELVRLMVANDLSELDLRDAEEQVTLRRQGPYHPGPAPVFHGAMPVTPAPRAAAEAAEEETGEDADRDLLTIATPMVGTFYAAPNPDSGPFVSVGSVVGPETVVCLIEAMKIFNEIKAEVSGTVERVLVTNGTPVEFGQALFLVRPA
jgi:acetyl-CoA carboxylase biotin carboxyl carrier protein